MSESKQQDLSSNALPFFARYLEGQFCEDLSEEETQTIQGGLRFAHPTRKFPGKVPDDVVTTMKYPSDHEDGAGGGRPPVTPPVTNRLRDQVAATKKYPSDNEEHVAVTLKYPSDGDD